MFALNMRVKEIFLAVMVVAIAAIFIFLGSGCANIVPPTGGPADSLPPVIVEVDPPNYSTNFNTKKINIRFDEYVELENPFQNLLISPLPKMFPVVNRKLKNISITLKDSLETNTTYVFNFKGAIKDITEGNKAKDLLYVFTTGNHFDTLQLSGRLKVARTDKPDSTLTIMLHRNLEDSAVAKERPRYIERLDSTGTFLFRYLAPGSYRLYALKDEGGSYRYTSPEQLFAFASDTIVLRGDTQHDPVLLYAYAETPGKKETGEEEDDDSKEKRLKFTTNLESDKQDLLQALVIRFDRPLRSLDTTKMRLSLDTGFVQAAGHRFTLDSTRRELTMNMPWQEKTPYHLILEKDFATDSSGRQLLKADTLNFETKAKTDYGQVKLTFIDLDMGIHPVLLLLQSGTLKHALPLSGNVINIQLINPGSYEMQILHDRNQNGRWDPGKFFGAHIQPERITLIERNLEVKPNWTSEFEVTLKAEK